jgi:hypothetical protein
MSDELENTETPDEDKSIWELLDLDEPEDEGEAEQEEQDAEIAKVDKIEKKLSAKMGDMQKKFDNTIMKERVGKFQDGATDLEKDLFKTIAADVKRPDDLDRAIALVKAQAATLQKQTDEYKVQMEKVAEEQASRAWGMGPSGTPTPRTPDYEEVRKKKIAEGDSVAALAALLEDDRMVGDIFR